MSLGHEYGLVLIGLAGPMDVVNLSLSLSADLLQSARDSMRNLMWHQDQEALSNFVIAILDEEEEEKIHYVHTASKGL